MLKTIQSKFLVFCCSLILIVASLTLVSSKMSSKEEGQATLLSRMAVITQRHMEADMMHDAMRGDVLAGVLAYKESNSEAMTNAKQELNDHYENFKENL